MAGWINHVHTHVTEQGELTVHEHSIFTTQPASPYFLSNGSFLLQSLHKPQLWPRYRRICPLIHWLWARTLGLGRWLERMRVLLELSSLTTLTTCAQPSPGAALSINIWLRPLILIASWDFRWKIFYMAPYQPIHLLNEKSQVRDWVVLA